MCCELEEVTLRNHFEDEDDEYFVCAKCFNKLKAIFACQSTGTCHYPVTSPCGQSRCKQLIDSLRESTSSSFTNLTNDCEICAVSCRYIYTDSVTDNDETESYDHETSIFSKTKKRCRNILTPSKSGCTPRAKRTARTPKAKNNRRRLLFSQTPQQVDTQSPSPGPKVKVKADFKGSCRKTDLKGHDKMACKAIVQKQYKTALNHLLEIEDAKKELSNTIKKRLNREVQKLCSAKDSVFRSTHITKCSWKSAYEEFAKNSSFLGIKRNRLVSSMLFTRNQKMNTLQAINSVLMFRGHVRSRVYSTFNRAGLCSSYKSTLNTIDRICESFDIPIKNWAKKVSSQSQTTCSTNKETSSGDHCYATPEDFEDSPSITHDHSYLSPDVCIYTAEVIQEETPQLDSIPQTPLNSKDHDGLDLATTMDSPFTTTQTEANAETGPFQIVMDNLNLQQKTKHKTLDTSNKMHNLVHSIAVQHRVTDINKDAIHPQADILSVPNDAFIPSSHDHETLYSDFKTLIKRALVENIPALADYTDLVEYHIPHKYSKHAEKKSNIIPLGILEKDENITEQMIDIIAHLQQYVPKTDSDKMIPILLGGDALSVERGEAAERARIDAITPEDRLDGFLWKSEDWHGHVLSLQETFNLLYKGTSSGEKGTLFQLRNAFDRRGVKSEVTNAVNDCREFLRFATKGYIVLAAFQLLGIKSPEEFQTAIKTKKTREEKEEFLTQLSSDIVMQFVETKQFHLHRPAKVPTEGAVLFKLAPGLFNQGRS